MKNLKIIYLVFIFISSNLYSQVENVSISHPVYSFLERYETIGYLEQLSLSSIPLQRSQIIESLEKINKQRKNLSNNEIGSLEKFLIEFEIVNRNNAVLIYSGKDSNQVLSSRIISNDEKFIYHFKDSNHSVRMSPLASLNYASNSTDTVSGNVLFGNLGVRLFGTLGNILGYNLQITNGVVIDGDKNLLLNDPKFSQNVKFSELNSDFDFTESSLRFQLDWFYAVYSRESRNIGSGLNQRLYVSTNSPAFDAVSLGVRFEGFEYTHSHAGVLGLANSYHGVGSETVIPDKYFVTHRFALRPLWGEVSFWESIIYSGRNVDFSYMNPLSFFKSLEHANRDRDNSLMGTDFTLRPFKNLQLKGTFILDDIIISRIGTNYWSNKTAWNISANYALPFGIDIGGEYSRVEPYTFSHFNPQNSYTNDSLLIGSNLNPNSDMISGSVKYWWGGRYPIFINVSYIRHGMNVFDESGALIKNVGGDPIQSRRPYNPETGFPGDSEQVTFLDGDLVESSNLQIGGGYELMRGFNLQLLYKLTSVKGIADHGFYFAIRFEDF